MKLNKVKAIMGSALVFVAAVAALPSLAQTAMTDAEVRKVDKANGRIILKHGEIKNLDMPAMTMVFGVKDAAMLDRVHAGDKIRLHAINAGGKIIVTEILPAK
jgi:Cu/Ag efflux protein CusF